MTPQEIFDTVCAHLAGMTAKSINESGMCTYRGPNGSKCAVGALIPDDMYRPWMDEDNPAINYMIRHVPQYFPAYFADNVVLLFALQNVHDAGDFTSPRLDMAGALARIAYEHRLDDTAAGKVVRT